MLISPFNKNNGLLKKITNFWKKIGCNCITIKPKQHDSLLALTSHLPHMLAYALVDCLASMQERDEIFKYAAGGFADFSRIASSSPEMWHDICFSNREALIRSLEIFSSHIDDIRLAIEKSESNELLKIFRRAKEVRDKFNKKKK